MGKRSRQKKGGGEAGAPSGAPTPERGAEAPVDEAEAAPQPQGVQPDGRLREVSMLVEEADYLQQLYRWVLLRGEVPRAADWMRREQWPHPDYVKEVFGSWDKFLDHAGVTDSPLLAQVRELEDARKRLKAAEDDAAKLAEAQRQADTARRAREAAQAERDEQRARADRTERQLRAAESRAADAEERLQERREASEDASRDASAQPAGNDPSVDAAQALRDELDSVRSHRDELLVQVQELRDAAETDQRTIARLSALLAESGQPAETTGGEAVERPPQTVLDAVRRAADHAEHLVFTDAAFDSAADSPYRRPEEVLDALEKLEELAAKFDGGSMGASLSQAATELGLTYKQGVSEFARSRNPHAYAVTHDGKKLELGPHVALGSGSGAGFIARIYLHVADGSGDVPRGLYVGHVGRHLPDTTT